MKWQARSCASACRRMAVGAWSGAGPATKRAFLYAASGKWGHLAIASCFTFLVLAVIAAIQVTLGNTTLVACLGGTAVVAFGMPDSRMAKARSLLGGHALACGVGIVLASILPDAVWVGPLGVGIALGCMRITSTIHSPAGGDPLIIAAAHGAWGRPMVVLAGGLLAIVVAARLCRSVTRWASRDGRRVVRDGKAPGNFG
jgi:CBS-domain-containing membrane protein